MSLWAANGALKCWPCLTYTALAAWSKIRHYKDQEANDIPQKIHLRVDWSRIFWRVEGRRPSDMIGVAERNQICPSSHYNSSLVILFSRSHSRKPCRLWTSSGRRMACAIMTLQDTGTRLCDYLVCWFHKTLHQSHRLLSTLGRKGTGIWLFIKSVKCAWSQGLLGQSLLPANYENVKILSFCHWSLLSCYVLTSDPIPKSFAFKHLSNMLSTHIRSFTTEENLGMSSSHSVCPALDRWPSLTGRDQEIGPVHGLGQWNKLRCYICPKAAVLKKTDKISATYDGDTWKGGKMVGILSSNAHLQASADDINFIPLWINLRASTFCSCIISVVEYERVSF